MHYIKRSRKNLILYYVMFFLIQLIKITEIYDRLKDNWLTYFTGLFIDMVALILHIFLSLSNPGYLQNDGIKFIKLLEIVDP